MTQRTIRFRRKNLDCFDVIPEKNLERLLEIKSEIPTLSQDYIAELSQDWDNKAHKEKTAAKYIDKARVVLRSGLPRWTWKEIERHQKRGHLDMQQLFAITDLIFEQMQEQTKADAQ